jgi:tRNA pseudouridine55 synthase
VQGILYIDKPAGWTSFDVVNYVRRIVAGIEGKKPKNVKVGHTGTLDPFATGLLIVLIGKNFTRQASSFSKLDKTYEVTAHLGKTSSTGDPEGDIDEHSDIVPSLNEIGDQIPLLTGEISQVPPAFSAIKVQGKRAYSLAREGKAVVLEPRLVTVRSLEVEKYEYPKLLLKADVSSGTYIRSLVESMGELLHTGAYTSDLRRVRIGTVSIERAQQIKNLSAENLPNLLEQNA